MRNPFRYFKTSPDIIRLAVMMYVRFPLSLRQVEEILHERGIDISYETVRAWWNRFGPLFAAEIRPKRSASLRLLPQWRWHLGEVFVRVNGEMHYLWRAVDAGGEVLDVFLQSKRDKTAASRFLRKAMKKHASAPVVIVGDKWRPTAAAIREIIPSASHMRGKRLNNRAENSHSPTRRRERKQQRFKSSRSAQ